MIEQLNELNEKVQKALSLSQSLVQERQKVLHEMNEAIRLKEVFESKYQQREASYLDMQRRVQEHDAIVQSLKQSLEQQLAQSERAREQLAMELSVLNEKYLTLEEKQASLERGVKEAQGRVQKVLQNLPTSRVDGA
ncbi:MAG: hypothetical protein KGV48_003340 [Alcaligenaceae bacterium]|nr:hypothetical protein [Alcaligenaceae bacterium]